jgi:hypothetical protein
MALFNECMPQCAQKVFDTADIVRDRDLTPIDGDCIPVGSSDNFRFADKPGTIGVAAAMMDEQ